jgi:hypothetical protein
MKMEPASSTVRRLCLKWACVEALLGEVIFGVWFAIGPEKANASDRAFMFGLAWLLAMPASLCVLLFFGTAGVSILRRVLRFRPMTTVAILAGTSLGVTSVAAVASFVLWFSDQFFFKVLLPILPLVGLLVGVIPSAVLAVGLSYQARQLLSRNPRLQDDSGVAV